jgi:hypothetical protein
MMRASCTAVHLLDELMELRRKWPLFYEQARTGRERAMSDVLDAGIGFALLAVGGPLAVGDEVQRAQWAALADQSYEVAAEGDRADDRWHSEYQRAREETVLPPESGDHPEYDWCDWWRMLGFDSLDQWQIFSRTIARCDRMGAPVTRASA